MARTGTRHWKNWGRDSHVYVDPDGRWIGYVSYDGGGRYAAGYMAPGKQGRSFTSLAAAMASVESEARTSSRGLHGDYGLAEPQPHEPAAGSSGS